MPSYSDSEMRAIMGRALQIDSGRSERFTPEQLRTIAAELGISMQALEVAMYEADSKGAGLMVDAPAPRAMSGWAKGVIAAVGALAILLAGFVASRRIPPRPEPIQVTREQPTPVVDQPAPAVKVYEVQPAGARPITKKTATKVVR